MKIEIIDQIATDNLDMIKFILDGVSIELANALRRIILTEVPTMAIEEVLFVENDTVLYDEIIAHRLGLIPLTTDLKNYNLPDECSCNGQGCTLCQVQFMLEVHANDEEKVVYSKDMEGSDPKVHPVSDNIIIAKLGKKTSLVFEAYAQLGRGKNHAKFQPVCAIGYKYYPDIEIHQELIKSEEEFNKIIHMCPAKCFINKDGILTTREDWWKDCSLCSACEKYSTPGAVRIKSVPNKFIFTMEGTGALPLKEVLEYAATIFLEKLEEFDDQLKKAKILPKVIESI